MNERKSDHPINPLILNRWSPRAMTGDALPEEVILSLFEAARWAPSSYNAQPWRFIYAKRNTAAFQTMIDLMVDFNKLWAPKAGLLGVIIARKTFQHNNNPSRTHAFDTGAAWENLALEGNSRGLVVHGMEGFDYEKAKSALQIPPEYEVLAMFAVGKRAPKESLPPELREKEVPSPRKKLEEFVMEGHFRG
ncbi:MAG: nitroreductase family protein [Verrucomicrobiota bacterium]|nr:nitroreductase family protein [Verrucomicrobiota bacterium]